MLQNPTTESGDELRLHFEGIEYAIEMLNETAKTAKNDFERAENRLNMIKVELAKCVSLVDTIGDDVSVHLSYVKQLASRVLALKRQDYGIFTLSKERQLERLYAACQLKSADIELKTITMAAQVVNEKRLALAKRSEKTQARYTVCSNEVLKADREYKEVKEKMEELWERASRVL